MTGALVLGTAAALLAAARWALTRRHTARRVYPPRGVAEEALLAGAERSLERSRALGATTGHLWAWRDLLSDTATEAATVPPPSEPGAVGGSDGTGRTNGTDGRLDTLRHELDAAEARIRTALADLDRHAGAQRRRAPWSG
ncbi:hypothetical protein DFP74_1823 [Nocardiopsis sp. Huas11]|uniref:hypothetical protein n=1 Tax=Nocardiopsis sp. Huas11 TaxID=2183912 RepID=UPI000EAFAC26|nr:hypothetical protein [Nocardiopsis sp. Huas11]RKS06199.1 hypothetical protein DFP74_1823 [Nocardiopsis sp. Huas11]